MRNPTISPIKKTVLLLFAAFLVASAIPAYSDNPFDSASHTRVGGRMPSITVNETSGGLFSLEKEKGKVVVVNFWATWCPPCQIEMPRLQKEVWEKYRASPDFAMVAVAREQTKETVVEFQQKHKEYTFPLAFDPDRATYKLFADSGIPRTYVVDRHGKIVFQSVGYEAGNFDQIDKAIHAALAAK